MARWQYGNYEFRINPNSFSQSIRVLGDNVRTLSGALISQPTGLRESYDVESVFYQPRTRVINEVALSYNAIDYYGGKTYAISVSKNAIDIYNQNYSIESTISLSSIPSGSRNYQGIDVVDDGIWILSSNSGVEDYLFKVSFTGVLTYQKTTPVASGNNLSDITALSGYMYGLRGLDKIEQLSTDTTNILPVSDSRWAISKSVYTGTVTVVSSSYIGQFDTAARFNFGPRPSGNTGGWQVANYNVNQTWDTSKSYTLSVYVKRNTEHTVSISLKNGDGTNGYGPTIAYSEPVGTWNKISFSFKPTATNGGGVIYVVASDTAIFELANPSVEENKLVTSKTFNTPFTIGGNNGLTATDKYIVFGADDGDYGRIIYYMDTNSGQIINASTNDSMRAIESLAYDGKHIYTLDTTKSFVQKILCNTALIDVYELEKQIQTYGFANLIDDMYVSRRVVVSAMGKERIPSYEEAYKISLSIEKIDRG